jgi:hypothetical protein
MLRWVGNVLIFVSGCTGGATWNKPTTAESVLISVTLLAGLFIHVYDEIENR